jgi:hypothetical protein
MLTPMRPHEFQRRANRNDPGGIDVVVGDVVMALDMVEVNSFGDARLLVEI